MATFLLYKWFVLLALEIVAWSATFFMLYARYRLRKPILFRVGAIATVLTGVIPQVLMGIINYYALGELDLFTLVIVSLILYGCTIGRKHVRSLDAWMLRRYGEQ